jgi:hypothetical protein
MTELKRIDRNAAIHMVQQRAEFAWEVLAQFSRAVMLDPSHTFQWGTNAAEAAARIDVCAEMLNEFAHCKTSEAAVTRLTETAHRAIREGLDANSTSPEANRTRQLRGKAWAEQIGIGGGFTESLMRRVFWDDNIEILTRIPDDVEAV